MNHLSGKIPGQLGLLSSMIYLDIPDNRLSGEIPDQFGSLLAMTRLGMNGNKLSGKIPDCMGSMTRLELALHLQSNRLSGKVIERAVTPMFAYGVHSSLPPVAQMKGLSSTIKQALWGPNKKRFHCWPLACAILYRAHCMDVKSALVL